MQKLVFTCMRLVFEHIFFVSTPPVASWVLLNGPLILTSFMRNKQMQKLGAHGKINFN